ncbi:iron ABC transporter permease [Patulibacter defluvii]|uniref:iron ABC transporter permease n=1 Tax=Patulibacter defluvii TaxID=3095358 RepID=UPI002A75F859|nr:iron ABC transporter permease [Patulibacter sp. DM4]
MRSRTVLLGALGLVALLLAALADLAQGNEGASLSAVLHGLVGDRDGLGLDQQFVVDIALELRGSRAAAGALAGATLAGSAVLLQSLTRNPLAEPATLGLSAGGALAVTVVAAFTTVAPGAPTIAVAFVGVALATALIGVLALAGGSSPVRLVLAGMAIALALGAIAGGIRLLRETETSSLFLWGAGSTAQAGWGPVRTGALIAAGTALVALLLTRALDVAVLGEERSRALGLRVGRTRALAVLVAAVLAAVSIGIAGPFAFVGVLAVGIARLSRPRGHLGLLLVSLPWGAAIVLAADVLARLLLGTEEETPAGILCALLGAPVLIVVARRLRDGGRPPLDRAGGIARWRPRAVLALAALTPLALLAGLAVGATVLDPAALLRGIVDRSSDAAAIVDGRAGRLAVALAAGAALACSGVLLQTAVRNPFAGPELIGVTGGASVGAFLVLLVHPGASRWVLPAAAFAGSLAAMLVVLLAAGRHRASPQRLALIGLSVTAATAAITTLMVLQAQPAAAQAITWLAGSTYATDWSDLLVVAPATAILTGVALLVADHLDVLALDDELARSLGLPVGRARVAVLVLGAAIAAVAVAVVGAVAFLGLLAPHLARLLAGGSHRRLIPVAMALGALLLGLADVLGRSVDPPLELPAGLVVAVIGAPCFAFMLWRSRAAA